MVMYQFVELITQQGIAAYYQCSYLAVECPAYGGLFFGCADRLLIGLHQLCQLVEIGLAGAELLELCAHGA